MDFFQRSKQELNPVGKGNGRGGQREEWGSGHEKCKAKGIKKCLQKSFPGNPDNPDGNPYILTGGKEKIQQKSDNDDHPQGTKAFQQVAEGNIRFFADEDKKQEEQQITGERVGGWPDEINWRQEQLLIV